MANGGKIVLEAPTGLQWLEKGPDTFIDWIISSNETYFVRGTRTGIYKWMQDHAGNTVRAREGLLYMQVRSLSEPLGKQLQKAYGGAAMGGTPISAITGLVGAAATSATALGAGASAAGSGAIAGAVFAAEPIQLGFDHAIDRAKGPGRFARGLDKLGMRDKYHVYFTAGGPKFSMSALPESTRILSEDREYDFADLATIFMCIQT
jgi:hypothetical protein